MHRSSNISAPVISDDQKSSTDWSGVQSAEDWFQAQPYNSWKESFHRDGFLAVQSLLSESELAIYRDVYDRLLSGKIDASKHRHDLGNHNERKTDSENICQIMWPSLYVSHIDEGPLHQRGKLVARLLLGDDMAFDFDMLLCKPPYSSTITPCHEDESYWLDMPDKRAVSCWVAMDETTIDNGCMWFSPGSHKWEQIRPHRPAKPGVHVLTCDGSEEELVPVPLKPGGATFHHGRTMHYSRGNSTAGFRRGYIANFRPESMVQFEREHNFDHGKQGLDNIIEKGLSHEHDP